MTERGLLACAAMGSCTSLAIKEACLRELGGNLDQVVGISVDTCATSRRFARMCDAKSNEVVTAKDFEELGYAEMDIDDDVDSVADSDTDSEANDELLQDVTTARDILCGSYFNNAVLILCPLHLLSLVIGDMLKKQVPKKFVHLAYDLCHYFSRPGLAARGRQTSEFLGIAEVPMPSLPRAVRGGPRNLAARGEGLK